MTGKELIYLDDMVLTYFCGAKEFRGSLKESRGIEALRIAVLSGTASLVASFAHRAALRKYLHRGRRARMSGIVRFAPVKLMKRNKRFYELFRPIRGTGLDRGDAAHAAIARLIGATLLTFDKEMLRLAHAHKALFGKVVTPSQWLGHANAAEEE